MRLIKDRLDKLFSIQDDRHQRQGHLMSLTNRFISTPSSCLTPTKPLTIFPIKSSRQITSSCPKYRIRHGLDTKRALGIRAVSRDVKVDGMNGRGRVDEDQGSSGPGTNTKWEEWSNGNESSKSVRALNPSGVTYQPKLGSGHRFHPLVYRFKPPSLSQPF